MRLTEKLQVHQAHPVKIGANLAASVVSNVLLWKARRKAAGTVHLFLPAAASAAVLSLADLDALAKTRHGQYVLAHMPLSAQVMRMAGDALMRAGARRRRPLLVVSGAAVIAVGWSHAAWPRHSRPSAHPPGNRGSQPANPAYSAGERGGT